MSVLFSWKKNTVNFSSAYIAKTVLKVNGDLTPADSILLYSGNSMTPMICQVLFSPNNNNKNLECSLRPSPGLQHYFVETDHNFFYSHSLLSVDSRRAVVSFWQNNLHNTG